MRNLLSNGVCVMAREADFKELEFAGPRGGSVSEVSLGSVVVSLGFVVVPQAWLFRLVSWWY